MISDLLSLDEADETAVSLSAIFPSTTWFYSGFSDLTGPDIHHTTYPAGS